MQERAWATSTLRGRTTGTKMESIRELKKKAAALEPIVRIGKSGLSGTVVGEIKKQIEQKKLIKVKMLRSFVGAGDKKKLAAEIAEKTGSTLVHSVGLIAVLAKK